MKGVKGVKGVRGKRQEARRERREREEARGKFSHERGTTGDSQFKGERCM